MLHGAELPVKIGHLAGARARADAVCLLAVEEVATKMSCLVSPFWQLALIVAVFMFSLLISQFVREVMKFLQAKEEAEK